MVPAALLQILIPCTRNGKHRGGGAAPGRRRRRRGDGPDGRHCGIYAQHSAAAASTTSTAGLSPHHRRRPFTVPTSRVWTFA